jgi:hypothetical protein
LALSSSGLNGNLRRQDVALKITVAVVILIIVLASVGLFLVQ